MHENHFTLPHVGVQTNTQPTPPPGTPPDTIHRQDVMKNHHEKVNEKTIFIIHRDNIPEEVGRGPRRPAVPPHLHKQHQTDEGHTHATNILNTHCTHDVMRGVAWRKPRLTPPPKFKLIQTIMSLSLLIAH